MKNSFVSKYCLFAYLCLCAPLNLFAQTTLTWYDQTFKIDTLYPATGSTGMNSPWEVLYGPDDSLWVTESHEYKIYKIHPGNKGSRVILDMSGPSYKNFAPSGQTSGGQTVPSSWPQGGLMGLAIHPQFNGGKPWVYIAYVYQLNGCNTCSGSTSGARCSYNTKIVRYQYNSVNGKLTYMDDVISGLNGSNDHNSGRLRISPIPESDGNYHLYYTIGDMGAGQLANICTTEHAQDTTVIEGKSLRLNTEPDAFGSWVPADNPFPSTPGSATRSPIYTFGHRNPQGLTFGSVDGGASYVLYSVEHGDRSDDEVNILTAGANYGWPKMAGLCDDNYTSLNGDSLYLAGQAVISESGFCDTTKTRVVEPIFSYYNWRRGQNDTIFKKYPGSNMYWPTVAPSSLAFYGQGAIAGWNNSLLITSLKNGLWRLKLKSDGLSVDSTTNPYDTLHYLPGYRLRNVTVVPTGDTLFLAVDNSCCTLGTSGILGNSVASPNLGFILRMVYLTTLPLDTTRKATPVVTAPAARIYPNPAHGLLYIDAPTGELTPWTAQLYSVTGQALLMESTGAQQFTLDIHGLKPGVYILRLTSAANATSLINKVLIE
jgi:PQQ-dependent dehydrogenase (s-GDH family)